MNREEDIRKFRVLEIVDFALRINSLEGTYEASEEKHTTIFADIAGHVGTIRVRVYENGWDDDADPDIVMEAHLDNDRELEVIADTLLKVLAQKEKLL